MTNGERADRLLEEAVAVGDELRGALARGRWNLVVRRAQEIVEFVIKALLNEMSVEYPRTHDAVPLLVQALARRKIEVDREFVNWLSGFSSELAEIRSPAFYHEIVVAESRALEAASGAERVLAFGREFIVRLRRP